MNKRFRSWLAAAVLLLFAVPIALEISGQPHRVGSSGGGPEVPAPFNDVLSVSSLPITDSLTTESDAMTQLTFAVDSQQFSFDDARPEAYSGGTAIDLTSALNDPTLDHDWIGLDIDLGTGLFADEYGHVMTALSFSRIERNLGAIASPGLASNLPPASNHQPPALITSPGQVSSVPEPTTSMLLGVALVLGFSALGRRKRA